MRCHPLGLARIERHVLHTGGEGLLRERKSWKAGAAERESRSQIYRGGELLKVKMGERDESGEEESEWETDEEEEGEKQDEEDSEDEAVVEEGCPVKPGDLLVSARPFVYAIQGQFKSKVCDWCFV